MTILCILPGPSHIYRTEPDERPTRWCFGCRKHLPHVWHLIGDPPEVETWYGLDWDLRCSDCGKDRTYFPGCGPL